MLDFSQPVTWRLAWISFLLRTVRRNQHFNNSITQGLRDSIMCPEDTAHWMCRGFTTLSAVLGKMAVCTHEALLQALSGEADSAALTAVLRFAAILCGAAPYHRLPHSLLPRFLQASAQHPGCLMHTCPDRQGRHVKRRLPPDSPHSEHSPSAAKLFRSLPWILQALAQCPAPPTQVSRSACLLTMHTQTCKACSFLEFYLRFAEHAAFGRGELAAACQLCR